MAELSGKVMPIQVGAALELRERRGRHPQPVVVRSIPWEMIAGDSGERWSQTNHGQTLSRIAERGGFSACEAIAVICGFAWRKLDDDDEIPHRILYSMLVLFNRGKLFAHSDESRK